jgi:hypothetical protein
MSKPSYNYEQHPRAKARKDEHPSQKLANGKIGLNERIGLLITKGVGTMWAAYAFFALTLVSLPAALASGNTLIIISWVAQTFLQLVLLPIIIVGQNLQAKDAERRAIATYEDAGAILEEAKEIQSHLTDQDKALTHLIDRMETLEKIVAKQVGKN